MWPADFFAAVRLMPAGRSIRSEIALRDHATIDGRLTRLLIREAEPGGLVCTLKDLAKLVDAVDERVPVWYVAERVVWEGRGGERLVEAARSLLPAGRYGPNFRSGTGGP
jgi:tetraacyldisaccharide-1-P 4'-kinase